MRNLNLNILILFIFIALQTQARNLSFPQDLSQPERVLISHWFAPSSTPSLLSTSYPLGGYSGFEFGLSHHRLPTSLINSLTGVAPDSHDDLSYPLLTLGKGLYDNTDIFVSFSPLMGVNQISHYSGLIRHEFWRSNSNHFRISAQIYRGSSNIYNQLNLRSQGIDFLLTSTFQRVSLYWGIGQLSSVARFSGGANGTTDSNEEETESLYRTRNIFGFEWPIKNYFIAAEINRMNLSYYAIKLGVRL